MVAPKRLHSANPINISLLYATLSLQVFFFCGCGISKKIWVYPLRAMNVHFRFHGFLSITSLVYHGDVLALELCWKIRNNDKNRRRSSGETQAEGKNDTRTEIFMGKFLMFMSLDKDRSYSLLYIKFFFHPIRHTVLWRHWQGLPVFFWYCGSKHDINFSQFSSL